MDSGGPELVNDIKKIHQEPSQGFSIWISQGYTSRHKVSDVQKARQAVDCCVTGVFPKP